MATAWRALAAIGVVVGVAIGAPAPGTAADDKGMSAEEKAMMETWQASMTPGPQHAELAKTVGTWTARTKFWMTPDAKPEASEGKAVRTMIFGGRVMREEFTGNWQGQPFVGVAHTGYDNVTGQYWATWMDNMMTGVAVLKGTYDEAEKTWTYEGETPNPMAGDLIPMRVETRMEGPDTEINEFFSPGPDGTMFRNMEIVYERQ